MEVEIIRGFEGGRHKIQKSFFLWKAETFFSESFPIKNGYNIKLMWKKIMIFLMIFWIG